MAMTGIRHRGRTFGAKKNGEVATFTTLMHDTRHRIDGWTVSYTNRYRILRV